MGMSVTRMAETMATLKVLAEENLQTLKKSDFKTPEDSLQFQDRIGKINELMEVMNYDWDHIPREWDDEKKAWSLYYSSKKEQE